MDYLGTALLKVLVADGHRVFGLAPSLEAAELCVVSVVEPVIGDLLEAQVMARRSGG